MPRKNDPIANSVWSRPQRQRRGQPTLSREQIVSAAIELLDADGIDGLSMRRLGARLGAGTTSVYWYVANKNELLDLALDEVMGEITLPDAPHGDWRTVAGAIAQGAQSTMVRHPWITSLFGVRPNIGPNAMRMADRLIRLLIDAGFAGLDSGYASSLLMSHAIGAATAEAAWRSSLDRSGMSVEELTRSIEAHERSVAADYPGYSAWRSGMETLDVAKLQKDSYAFGLERLLDGLQTWLDRTRNP